MAKKTDEIKIKVTSDTGVARKGISELIKKLNQLEKQAAHVTAAMNKASMGQRASHRAYTEAQQVLTKTMARTDKVFQKATRNTNRLSSALINMAKDMAKGTQASNLALRGILRTSVAALKAAQSVRKFGRAIKEAGSASAANSLRNLSIGIKMMASNMRQAASSSLKNFSLGIKMFGRDAVGAGRNLKNMGLTAWAVETKKANQAVKNLINSISKFKNQMRQQSAIGRAIKNTIGPQIRQLKLEAGYRREQDFLARRYIAMSNMAKRMRSAMRLEGPRKQLASLGQSFKNFPKTVSSAVQRYLKEVRALQTAPLKTPDSTFTQGRGGLPRNIVNYLRDQKAAFLKHLRFVKRFNSELKSIQDQASPFAKATVAVINFGRKTREQMRNAAASVRNFAQTVKTIGASAMYRGIDGLNSRMRSFTERARQAGASAVSFARKLLKSDKAATRFRGGVRQVQSRSGRWWDMDSQQGKTIAETRGARVIPNPIAPIVDKGIRALGLDKGFVGRASAAQSSINGIATATRIMGRGFIAAGKNAAGFFSAFRSFDPSALISNLMALPNRVSFAFWKLNNMFWMVRRGAQAVTSVVKTLTAGFADQIQTAEEYHRMRLPIDMLKQLRVVAKMTDASMSEVQVIVKNLNRSLDRATGSGVNRYNKALEMIGINMEDVRAGTVDAFQVMKALGSFMQKMPASSPVATEVMSVLGGKGGFRGAPVFSFLAREDFPMLVAATERLGLELGKTTEDFKKAVDTAHEIKIAFTFVTTIFDGFINQLNLGMGPSVLSALNLVKALALQIRIAGKSIAGVDGYFQTLGRRLGSDFYQAIIRAGDRFNQFIQEIQETDRMKDATLSMLDDIGEEFGYWSAKVGMKMLELGGAAGLAFGRGFISGVKDYLEENPLAQVIIGALGGMAFGSVFKGAISIGGKAAQAAGVGGAAAAGGSAAAGIGGRMASALGSGAAGRALGSVAISALSSKFLAMLMGGLIVPMVVQGMDMIGRYAPDDLGETVAKGSEAVALFTMRSLTFIIGKAFEEIPTMVADLYASMARAGDVIRDTMFAVMDGIGKAMVQGVKDAGWWMLSGVMANFIDLPAPPPETPQQKLEKKRESLGLGEYSSRELDRQLRELEVERGQLPEAIRNNPESKAMQSIAANIKLAELSDFQSQMAQMMLNLDKIFEKGGEAQGGLAGFEAAKVFGDVAGRYSLYDPNTEAVQSAMESLNKAVSSNDRVEIKEAFQRLVNTVNEHADTHEAAAGDAATFAQSLEDAKFGEKVASSKELRSLAISSYLTNSGQGNFITTRGMNNVTALMKQKGAPSLANMTEAAANEIRELISVAYIEELATKVPQLKKEMDNLAPSLDYTSDAFIKLRNEGRTAAEAQKILAEETKNSTDITMLSEAANKLEADGMSEQADQIRDLIDLIGGLAIARAKADQARAQRRDAARTELDLLIKEQEILARYGLGGENSRLVNLVGDNPAFRGAVENERQRDRAARREIFGSQFNDPVEKGLKLAWFDLSESIAEADRRREEFFTNMTDDVVMLSDLIGGMLDKQIDALFEGESVDPGETLKDLGKTVFKGFIKDKLKYFDKPFKTNILELTDWWQNTWRGTVWEGATSGGTQTTGGPVLSGGGGQPMTINLSGGGQAVGVGGNTSTPGGGVLLPGVVADTSSGNILFNINQGGGGMIAPASNRPSSVPLNAGGGYAAPQFQPGAMFRGAGVSGANRPVATIDLNTGFMDVYQGAEVAGTLTTLYGGAKMAGQVVQGGLPTTFSADSALEFFGGAQGIAGAGGGALGGVGASIVTGLLAQSMGVEGTGAQVAGGLSSLTGTLVGTYVGSTLAGTAGGGVTGAALGAVGGAAAGAIAGIFVGVIALLIAKALEKVPTPDEVFWDSLSRNWEESENYKDIQKVWGNPWDEGGKNQWISPGVIDMMATGQRDSIMYRDSYGRSDFTDADRRYVQDLEDAEGNVGRGGVSAGGGFVMVSGMIYGPQNKDKIDRISQNAFPAGAAWASDADITLSGENYGREPVKDERRQLWFLQKLKAAYDDLGVGADTAMFAVNQWFTGTGDNLELAREYAMAINGVAEVMGIDLPRGVHAGILAIQSMGQVLTYERDELGLGVRNEGSAGELRPQNYPRDAQGRIDLTQLPTNLQGRQPSYRADGSLDYGADGFYIDESRFQQGLEDFYAFTYMWSNFGAPGTGSWRETQYYTEDELMLKLGERGFDPSSFVGGGAPGEVTPVVGAPDGGTISRTDFARAARDKDLMDAADREDYIKELTEQGYRIDPERFDKLLRVSLPSAEIITGALNDSFENMAEFEMGNFYELIGQGLSQAVSEAFVGEMLDESLIGHALIPVFDVLDLVSQEEGGLDLFNPEDAALFSVYMSDGLEAAKENLEIMRPTLEQMAEDGAELQAEIDGIFSNPVDEFANAIFDAVNDGVMRGLEVGFGEKSFAGLTELEIAVGGAIEMFVYENTIEGMRKGMIDALVQGPAYKTLMDFIKLAAEDGFNATEIEWIKVLMAQAEAEGLDLAKLFGPGIAEIYDAETAKLKADSLAWFTFLKDFSESQIDSLSNGFMAGFEKIVNNPDLSRGEIFDELGRSLERSIYNNMLKGIISAAIQASALQSLFEQIGGAIALGVAQGFTPALLASIAQLTGAAVDTVGVIWEAVGPIVDPFLEKVFEVKDVANETQDQIESATKSSCDLEYRYAEARAGAAILGSLGARGNVYGGVAMASTPGTFTPSPGGGGSTGGGGGSTGGGSVSTGGGTVGAGTPKTPMTLPEFIQQYQDTPSAQRGEKYSWEDPAAYMAQYGVRNEQDKPIEPVDPARLPDRSTLGGWGQHFYDLNSWYWNSIAPMRGHGYNLYQDMVRDQGNDYFAKGWNPSSPSAQWWGSGDTDPDWKVWQHTWATNWFNELFSSMKGSGWPRQFAEGGVVTGPMMGIVGEAGPEAIIPLSKINEVTDTIYSGRASGGSGPDLAAELAEMRAAISELAEAISEQPVQTTVEIDGKSIVKATSRKARGLSKGNAYIVPSNTVK